MIYNTSVTILIISPHMKESNWISWELEYALKNQKRGEHFYFTDEAPMFFRRHDCVCRTRVGVRMTTYHKFSKKQGNANYKHAYYIYNEKRAAAIVSRLCGKPPNISETHCRTSRNEYCSQLTSKITSWCHIYF